MNQICMWNIPVCYCGGFESNVNHSCRLTETPRNKGQNRRWSRWDWLRIIQQCGLSQKKQNCCAEMIWSLFHNTFCINTYIIQIWHVTKQFVLLCLHLEETQCIISCFQVIQNETFGLLFYEYVSSQILVVMRFFSGGSIMTVHIFKYNVHFLNQTFLLEMFSSVSSTLSSVIWRSWETAILHILDLKMTDHTDWFCWWTDTGKMVLCCWTRSVFSLIINTLISAEKLGIISISSQLCVIIRLFIRWSITYH